jgi:intraflagellar transport protein 88
VECEVYEQAVRFYEGAIVIQPNEPKWKMMLANCYRKSANFQKAFTIYKKIHNQFPENVECTVNNKLI